MSLVTYHRILAAIIRKFRLPRDIRITVKEANELDMKTIRIWSQADPAGRCNIISIDGLEALPNNPEAADVTPIVEQYQLKAAVLVFVDRFGCLEGVATGDDSDPEANGRVQAILDQVKEKQ